MINMAEVQYHDDWGDEHTEARSMRCEFCGGPVDRKGDHVQPVESDDRPGVIWLLSLIQDSPRQAVALAGILYGLTHEQIADRISSLTGKSASRQSVHDNLLNISAKYPRLQRLLFARKGATSDKSVNRCSSRGRSRQLIQLEM